MSSCCWNTTLKAALLWLALAVPALAQPVSVIGPVTPGDCVAFFSTTQLKDAGSVCLTGNSFANPSASVGLTAVNGVAGTAMRSDAAPPLSASVQSALTGTSNIILTGTGAFGFSSAAIPAPSIGILSWNGAAYAWTSAGAGSVSTPGAGLVSSVTAACSQVPNQSTLSASECVNAQVGASYAIADSDRAKLITASNAAAQAYTIAQAGTASAFQTGWYTDLQNNSASGAAGAGTVTVTATTSTFSSTGTTALKVYPGQTVRIISDGANYQTINITPGGGSSVLLATLVASASATISDTTSITSAFNEYELVFENVTTSTAASGLILLVHSGGTFQNTTYVNSTGSVANGVFSGTAATVTSILASAISQNTGVPGLSGSIKVFAPSLTTTPKMWIGFTAHNNNASGLTMTTVTAIWNGGNGAIDGFQICYSTSSPTCTGTLSGTIKVYGKK